MHKHPLKAFSNLLVFTFSASTSLSVKQGYFLSALQGYCEYSYNTADTLANYFLLRCSDIALIESDIRRRKSLKIQNFKKEVMKS